jgi:hypothetical protein
MTPPGRALSIALEYHYFPAKTGMDDTGSQTNMNDKPRFSALIALSALLLGFSCVSVQANNTQQDKMKSCNADATAKNLTGDDRKTYMKTCLSNKPAAATASGNSQQQKMKTCNADATSRKLTGDDRKAYMKTCLSGASSSTAPAPAGAGPAGAAPSTK